MVKIVKGVLWGVIIWLVALLATYLILSALANGFLPPGAMINKGQVFIAALTFVAALTPAAIAYHFEVPGWVVFPLVLGGLVGAIGALCKLF